ncbi:hypothetical protein CIC12_20355 [Burkholderia sp. SG-MS1]|uniref:SDR family NAD(P)-dependent oxidoreductase n=1 Tax=Paraburkholderia sp. SG-MS1 TaxID=2023741 RepID=UPI0014477344|nr:SDR family oxidoreductase [Paraburkholderia sp. SG-MS1]NKJ49045.1 hypothetical protein [Paraburkholderia sp. SG-MS1]
MSDEFIGFNVFISGSGKGLGRSTSIHLAKRGARVGVSDIDGEACDETIRLIREGGGEAYGFICDLSDRAAFHHAVGEFARKVGPLDAMINNASILRYEPIENVTPETLDLMLGGGLKTVMWGTQALLAHMNPEKGASIINYASPVSYRGYPNTAVYSAVKGAVLSLTRVMAAELGPRGVRVNAVAPGSVPTPGATAYVGIEEYDRRAQSIPLRRLGRDEDNAAAVAFLLSRDATFINGAVLNVDGGIVAAG